MAQGDGDKLPAVEHRHDFGLDELALGRQPWGKAVEPRGEETVPLRQLSDWAGALGVVTTTADKVFSWAHANSLWPLTFGLACCAIEMMATAAPHYDLDRFGVMLRASPRQADVMLVAGTVTNKMAPVIRQLYQQMPEPRWVISMGACATSTGVFSNYAIRPVNQVIPVDVYVPGCPPRPEQLIFALMTLQKKIEKESGTAADILNLS